MTKKFTSVITKEENWYVAHCVELGVVSQGKTVEESQNNLKKAVELYLESFGAESPRNGATSHVNMPRSPRCRP